MFPYVFLGNVEQGMLKSVIDPSHKCISAEICISNAEKQKYKEYARFIGSLILKEAGATDDFMEKNRLKQSKVLPACMFPAEDPNDWMQAKEITKLKIRMAMELMDKKPYSGLNSLIQAFISASGKSIASFEEISLKEKQILG